MARVFTLTKVYSHLRQRRLVEMVSKHEDLTQAEEVNDSGQALPKVSPKDGDSVDFTERNFVKAFKRLPQRVFKVMVGLVYEN